MAQVAKSAIANPWFDTVSYEMALKQITGQFLEEALLRSWIKRYKINAIKETKIIGLILAGNIPLVGLHDVLCVYLSGHLAHVKLSAKDKYVLRHLVEVLADFDPGVSDQIQFVERLKNVNALIGTGTDNTKMHLDYYFDHVPRLLRGNRNSVAVLDGKETLEELELLAGDIFSYYGLGCRNVSKLYVPEDYDFESLVKVLASNRKIINHPKYANNYDYNLAVLTINKIKHINCGNVLIIEDKALTSRIATLHVEYYDDLSFLKDKLVNQRQQIQCVVSHLPLKEIHPIAFGDSIRPGLSDYADGLDTMHFLINLQ